MALIRVPVLTLIVALVACTDAQLEGLKPIDLDGRADTGGAFETRDGGVDDADATIEPPDTEDPRDTVVPPDTADTSDVGCTSNAACRAVLGPLGPCEDPICEPATGTCRAATRADCCAQNSDCPRLDDPCLSNRCPVPGGGCVALNICNPCRIDGDCPSNDPCTIGRCGADGDCSYERNPACNQCETDLQCDDQVACTKDFCLESRCLHEPAPGCCTLDSDCRDEDPCTRDFCRPGSGICGFEVIPGCADCTPELCDDFDPCTQDICSDLGCDHITDPDCRGCQGDGQCNDGDECTSDQCLNGRCLHDPAIGPDGQFVCACETNDQCDDGNDCTRDFCDGAQCFNFADDSLPGCGACGGSDCDDFDDCTTDFCDGFACQHVSTPGIPGCGGRCRNDADCEVGDQCTKAFCDASIGACVTVSVPDCCQSVMQCDDGDPCSEDACLDDGRCLHQPIPGCADCEVLCDDGDVCTIDRCSPSNFQCFNEPIPGCGDRCQSDFDCEDTSDCTLNSCVNGNCEIGSIPGCCRNAEDCRDGNPCTSAFCFGATGTCVIEIENCDDDDPCTIDRCSPDNGECESVPNPGAPECRCVPEVLWTRKFVEGETPDIDIDGSGFGVGWRVDGVRAFSPSRSLHYGDEQGEDYATGFRTFGRATGPELEVPSLAGSVRLDFMVWLDIDPDPELDSFRARVLYGNQNEIAWDRVSVGPEIFERWFPVSVALPRQVIGEQIRIRFVFDTLNGEGNTGQGVFVDDIVVQTTCP